MAAGGKVHVRGQTRLSSARTPAPRGPGDETTDPRVQAVLEVLGGEPSVEVAQRYAVEASLLRRWVRAFVRAGSAQVTNRPDPETAGQRDRFLAAFAHELRTPLAVAKGWASMLEDADLTAEEIEPSIRRVQSALDLMTERIVDVEMLAAASLGRLRLNRERLVLGDLVTDLAGLEGVVGAGPEVQVEGDPSMLRRVLRDLWVAGATHPAPRSCRLESARVGPWVELRVVREADPIEPALLHALFEPFDTNADDTGITIGLYLARALVVAHGGTLGVDQDDTHAVLWVRIPAHEPQHQEDR